MAQYPMHAETTLYKKALENYNDFQRQYLYRVILPSLGISGALHEVVTYFVSSTSTPQETTGTIPVDWQNSQIKVGGRTVYAEWNVTVKDTITSDVFKYFDAWRALVYNRDTGVSEVPARYKFNIALELIGETADRNLSFDLINSYPTTVGPATLDYSAEALYTFQVTFAFDLFKVK